MLKLLFVWIALIALVVATYLLAKVPTGDWSLAIALAIASAKAVLIILFFMELAQHRGASAIAFGTSVVFIVLLLTFALFDVGLRFEPTKPPGPLVRPLEPREGPMDPMKRYDVVPFPEEAPRAVKGRM